MQWWNDFVDWFYSEDGWRVLSSAVIPFLAIVVAGLVAALIGRGMSKRQLAHHDRERRVATVTALISAARRASKWNTLSLPEQQHADHLAHDADVSMRLLPLNGSAMVADWAAHELAEMKRNSVSFSFQAEQSLMDFRDRLVEWQGKPSRAKKLFKADLDLWAHEAAQNDQTLVQKQQEWAARQVASETGPITTQSARPAAWESTPDVAPSTSEAVPTSTLTPAAPNAALASSQADTSTSEVPAAAPAQSDDGDSTTVLPQTAASDPAPRSLQDSSREFDSLVTADNETVPEGEPAAEPFRPSVPAPSPAASAILDPSVPIPVSANTVRQRTTPETDEQ